MIQCLPNILKALGSMSAKTEPHGSCLQSQHPGSYSKQEGQEFKVILRLHREFQTRLGYMKPCLKKNKNK